MMKLDATAPLAAVLTCCAAMQQQEQSGQIQNKSEKALWNDKKYDEIPKVAICTRFEPKNLE